MLSAVRSATELAVDIIRLTNKFPPEERFVLTKNLRDLALTVLEFTALGMARFDIPHRYNFLAQAMKSLVELNSQCMLCRTMRYITIEDHAEIVKSMKLLRKQLLSIARNVSRIDISIPP